MSNTVKQLGFIPTNRGEFDTTGQTRYYKDNVVQYRNGSYICSPVGYSSSNPTAYTTDAPYQDGDTELNANWKLMASVGLVDEEPTAGSENLVKSGGVKKESYDVQEIAYAGLGLKRSLENLAGSSIDTSNLANPEACEIGRVNSLGNIQYSENYRTTFFIPVTPNTTYNIITCQNRSVQYDINKNVLSETYNSDSTLTQITTSANSYYIRLSFSVNVQTAENFYFGLGNQFVKYGLLAFGDSVINGSALTDNSVGKEKFNSSDIDNNPIENSTNFITSDAVFQSVKNINNSINEVEEGNIVYEIIRSANIHNSLSAAAADAEEPTDGRDWLGHSLSNSGQYVVSADYTATSWIEIYATSSYKSNIALRKVHFYNENKVYLSRINDETPAGNEITPNQNAKYVRFFYQTSLVNNPGEVKFGKYTDDINVPYSVIIKDKDKYNRELAFAAEVERVKNESRKNRINILLIGSSLGVNTIIQVPYLINSCGVKTTIGNMYFGSATLEQWADKFTNNTSVSNCAIYTSEGGNWVKSAKTPQAMLDAAKWDVIILQRGAEEACQWTTNMSTALGTIIDNIKSRIDYAPKIMFNCTPARSVEYFEHGNRQNQINYTKNIMITAKQMQEEYGLEIISSAIAIQNARNTLLAQYGTYDGGTSEIPDLSTDRTHLDIGVGSYVLGAAIVEQILASFQKSMIANSFFPTAAQLATREVWTAGNYTDPSNITNYFRIANACAFSSVLEPWQLNKILPTKYPMPGATPSDWDLDIDYSSIYNEGDTDQTPDVDPT